MGGLRLELAPCEPQHPPTLRNVGAAAFSTADGAAMYASLRSSKPTSVTVHDGSSTGCVVRTSKVDCRSVWLCWITV